MSFSMVALGEVVLPVERAEVPGAGTTYRQVGVKLWGVGAYERESMDGSQTRYKTLSRVEADDIIVNKIWARNGSVAVVPKILAGCFVSSEFPTFIPIREKLDPRWFHWLSKTKSFWEKCDEKSQGTSGKNRIRPERFLEIEIPLPPLPEQRRIVARIEELAAKIEEARGLREKAGEEGEAIMAAYVRSVFSSLAKKGLYLYELAAEIANGQGLIEGDRDQAGEYAVFGSGGQVGKHNDALMTEPFVVIGRKGSAGKVSFASEGGWVTDTAYYAFPRNPKELECKYLFYATKSLDFTDDVITTAIPGINRTAIYAHKIPLLPLPEQRRIVAYLTPFRQRWTRSGAFR